MHNRRNQKAAKRRAPAAKAKAKPKSAPAFPAEIQIPPQRGATARLSAIPVSVPLAIPLAAAPPPAPARVAARPLFAMPSPEVAAERPRTRRKVKAKTKTKPRAAKKAKPVIALPAMPEPLVATAPLPKARAMTLHRPPGLLDQLTRWLGSRLAQTWQRLGGIRPDAGAEIKRLQQENARLQVQLEALLALHERAATKRVRKGNLLPQA
ncbi:MAG: hypothetical protein KGZ65_09650 [Sphingomonadales bacterium]|nr:hypothetical protein [Sphingomonadales bacterium]